MWLFELGGRAGNFLQGARPGSMEGFWSPLELLSFLVWLCDLWVGVGVGGGLARKWDGFSGGAVGSLIVGG